MKFVVHCATYFIELHFIVKGSKLLLSPFNVATFKHPKKLFLWKNYECFLLLRLKTSISYGKHLKSKE